MCSIMGWCRPAAPMERFIKGFEKTKSRGPDDSRVVDTGKGLLGFHQLAIMGLHPEVMQPFGLDGSWLVCNGEIYGFDKLKSELLAKGYTFRSESDCEILLPLYREYGLDMFRMLDAEFALVLYEGSGGFVAARDPIGIRPLYYGYDETGAIVFASEAKNLVDICAQVRPFPPGHYYKHDKHGKFVCYRDITEVKKVCSDDLDAVCAAIREKLTAGVEKRLVADAKVGFLLSGGLDSSLVCAVAQRCSDKPIRTFAIGMSQDAIDSKYAKEAVDYIGSAHTQVYMTPDEVLSSLETVIALLGTYDITTIRASVGMYLVCKDIHEQTDIRELHMYDVLRADRCISVNSLEARVPFGDLDFVEYVMSIDPELKMNKYGKGKYLLRKAFEGDYLPDSILWRKKAAFSDAVGHSMVDDLKEYAESRYTDEEFEAERVKYTHARPFTKESLLYREIFEKHYPGQSGMVADFWMPNRTWPGCDVNDLSARVLSNYGDSGK